MSNGKTATQVVDAVIEEITLPQLEICTMELKLIGDSPLISNQFPEKARKQMEDKHKGAASAGRPKRKPKEEYKASLYTHPGGGYGFKATAFKLSAIRGAKAAGAIMADMRGAFHVIGVGEDQLVQITGKPSMRTDMVRLAKGGTCDLRYRGQFKEWSTTLLIKYNARAVTPAQIINFFRLAGFGVGIGEWRCEHGGQYGAFHVAIESEAI